MIHPVNVIFDNLTAFYYTMLLRKEAYQHATELNNFSIADKRLFSLCIKESESSISSLSDRLDDISDNMQDLHKTEKPPLKCGFYYGMAKSTSLISTVCLSLQLGDSGFRKNFEELLAKTEMKYLQNIKEDLKICFDCLKRSVQNEQRMNKLILQA